MRSDMLILTASVGSILMVLTGCDDSDRHRTVTAETAVSKAEVTTPNSCRRAQR